MPWGAAIAAVGAIGQGVVQEQGANSASRAGQTAANTQLAVGTQTYNNANILNLPTRELGGLAQSRLAYRLGLTPNLDISPNFSVPNISIDPKHGTASTTWGGPGSGYGNTSSGNPNMPGVGGSNVPIKLQPGHRTNGMVTGPDENGQGSQTTVQGGGNSGIPDPNEIYDGSGYGGLVQPFTADSLLMDPSYNFRQNEGQKAIIRQNSAAGHSSISGAALKEAMGYASDLASQEYGAAWNRNRTGNLDEYNMLAGLSGSGQIATQSSVDAGTNFNSTASGAATNYGNAGMYGAIGGANATTGMVGGITDAAVGAFDKWKHGSTDNSTLNEITNIGNGAQRIGS